MLGFDVDEKFTLWAATTPEDTRRETTQARLGVHTSSYHGPTHFQLPWPYTFPVTMALHTSSYHGPTCVEAWLLFIMEQSVSNDKEVLPHE